MMHKYLIQNIQVHFMAVQSVRTACKLRTAFQTSKIMHGF